MGKRIDISGLKFGRLTALEFCGKNKHGQALWKCRCDCGKEVIVVGKSLRTGNTKSCGCYNVEQSEKRIVALNTKHGKTTTRLFRIWSSMKTRCYNPKAINYSGYGGRGIFVCDEWLHDFQAFYDWAMKNGYRDDLTIDRIDNDRGYSPDNCRWATAKEQQNNRRSNRVIEFMGQNHTISEWSDIVGISQDALQKRIHSGRYTVEQALTEPSVGKGQRFGKTGKSLMAEYARRKMGAV